MSIREIQAKSILRKQKKIDSWFVSCYGMNLYRGCLHNCTYCDGRSEKYNVDGEFGHDVAVKINAIDILKRELNPQKKRVPFKRCFFTVGGGVCDAYQKPEKKYQLTRQALELLAAYGYPVAILTKSTLVKRDINLLKQINQKSRAVLCFSISSTDEHLSSIFEPGVPSPGQRLQAISLFKDNGIACGVYLLPVIPYITDTEEIIEQSVAHSCAAGADYIIFGGMTLKQGRQKEHFYKILKTFNPDLIKKYDAIYKDQKWGQATNEYYAAINKRFLRISKKYKIAPRMPYRLFHDLLDTNDLCIVMLEHIDYISKLEGNNSPYGYAAYSISKLKHPLKEMKSKLRTLSGVGAFTEKIILQILENKRPTFYDKLFKVFK